jgi:hypothetical protein
MREYYQLHKEEMVANALQRQAAFPEQHSAAMRRYALKKRYGIAVEDYDTILAYANQHGQCAICRRTLQEVNQASFYVDHNHDTGRVRGLLCARCNFGIGWHSWLVDNKESIDSYLEER